MGSAQPRPPRGSSHSSRGVSSRFSTFQSARSPLTRSQRLVEWHLIRLRRISGSRRDHYEAATDFFRAFQEIFERRFRWTVRQVLDVVGETDRSIREADTTRAGRAFVRQRLAALGNFFGLIDAGIGAFLRGEPFPAQKLAEVVPLARR